VCFMGFVDEIACKHFGEINEGWMHTVVSNTVRMTSKLGLGDRFATPLAAPPPTNLYTVHITDIMFVEKNSSLLLLLMF